MNLLDSLVTRCTFPAPGTDVACAFSGGPDSTALVALAARHGLVVTAHHVDHQLRARSADDAERAARIADRLGVGFVVHRVSVEPGANVEDRARSARRSVLPTGAMSGHTADDQAETVVLRLLRGSGATGLAAMRPGFEHPILDLRRSETHALCRSLGIEAVHDESNEVTDVWRNQVRHDVLPRMAGVADRDVVPVLVRTAALLRDDDDLLNALADAIDPTDARALASAPRPVARRAVRRWLTADGHPPDSAAVERVLAVARGEVAACEIAGGVRVERSRQRVRVVRPGR